MSSINSETYSKANNSEVIRNNQINLYDYFAKKGYRILTTIGNGSYAKVKFVPQ